MQTCLYVVGTHNSLPWMLVNRGIQYPLTYHKHNDKWLATPDDGFDTLKQSSSH